MIPIKPALVLMLIGVAALPGHAWAHAFGTRYDLPLPLWIYLTGAAGAVLLSFLVMALILVRTGRIGEFAEIELSNKRFGRIATHRLSLGFLRLAAVAVFLLVLIAGIWGNQDPVHNLSPTLVWVIWWVGMAFISSLVGDLWRLINPWVILFDWASALRRRLFPGRPGQLLPFPDSWGQWPALLLFFAFIWIELIGKIGAVPFHLSVLIIAYSIITWLGMLLFGKNVWLRRGEAFSVAFGLFARFAPFCAKSPDGGRSRLIARPYGVGLLTDKPLSWSESVFVLFLLASVSFDGLLATFTWNDILNWILSNPLMRDLMIGLRDRGLDPLLSLQTLTLLAAPLVFALIYGIFCRLTALVAPGGPGAGEIFRWFILVLMPIAIAYHLSHYLSYLLITGQQVIPLVSDPLGTGANWFGSAEYRVDIGLINAKFVWYFALVAIILGHVYAVYLGHVLAIGCMQSRRSALLSQWPMLVLMLLYTVLSLWILSQPIVNGG